MDPASHPEAKRFLLSIPVFGALPDRSADKLLELIEVRRHHPGDVVCAEGEPGRPDVSSGRGGSRSRRSATVTARQETELYVLSKARR